jgi:hypothetical protein
MHKILLWKNKKSFPQMPLILPLISQKEISGYLRTNLRNQRENIKTPD